MDERTHSDIFKIKFRGLIIETLIARRGPNGPATRVFSLDPQLQQPGQPSMMSSIGRPMTALEREFRDVIAKYMKDEDGYAGLTFQEFVNKLGYDV